MLFNSSKLRFFKTSSSSWTNILCHSNKKSSLGQMTNNIKNIDLLYFQGLIKRTTFYIKPKEDVDSDYDLEILISINI